MGLMNYIKCLFLGIQTQGVQMAKADVISAAITAIQVAEVAAMTDQMGKVWDEAAIEQKTSDGTLTQTDLDAAIAKVKADDAVAMTAAVKVVQDQLDAMTVTHAALVASDAALVAKEAGEAAQIVDLSAKAAITDSLKASLTQLQAGLDALKALIAPVA